MNLMGNGFRRNFKKSKISSSRLAVERVRSRGNRGLGRANLLQDEDEKAIADFERALKLIGANTPRGQVISEELNTLKKRKR